MTTAAIVTMLTTMSIITFFTVWFFIRILKAPLPDTSSNDAGALTGPAPPKQKENSFEN